MIQLISFKNTYLFLVLLLNFQLFSCTQKVKNNEPTANKKTAIKQTIEVKTIETGANQTHLYLPILKGKNIAVVANQTSVISSKKTKPKQYTHLIDSLLNLDISIKKVFAPEHGFRGNADAGELVADGIDMKTAIPVVSLYGKNKKPSANHLKNIDLVVFDIQDVGARFYTYLSTLHYVMEACAELNIPVLILDRPNPNGHYIDGPVLEMPHKSFVGMHPVPVVYGMTIGEYAQMINGEKWLKSKAICNLTVIPLKQYNHNKPYILPIKPSPNLPNAKSINLYPSLCFFEGTNVSAGRGTQMQFQIYGSPYLTENNFTFTPKPNNGAKYPKHKNKLCFGKDLRTSKNLNKINLTWLLKAYKENTSKPFFNSFFTKLAGTKTLQKQLEKNLNEQEIRKSWQHDLEKFKTIRAKYLLYE